MEITSKHQLPINGLPMHRILTYQRHSNVIHHPELSLHVHVIFEVGRDNKLCQKYIIQ